LPENILITSTNDVIFVDWGSVRLGPRWMDQYFFLLNVVEFSSFDIRIRENHELIRLPEEALNTLLLLQTVSVLWYVAKMDHGSLPGLTARRQARAQRMLTGLQRRVC